MVKRISYAKQSISHLTIISPDAYAKPICIKKDTFGQHLPMNDLYVSPEHNLLFKGKILPARLLIDGKNVVQICSCPRVEYYHVEVDKHCLIIAENILAESYTEVNNRYVFDS